MAIAAQDVNKLRKMTGAGMMDCKKALTEANGDFDAAIEILRKKGQKVAAKRADRETTEGGVFTQIVEGGKKGYLIALGCETDFVAKNEDFQKLGQELVEAASSGAFGSKEDFLASNFQGSTVSEVLTENIGKIGEKIEITDFEVVEGDSVDSYIHSNGKLGVIISFAGVNGTDMGDLGKDLTMQIAAMNPIAIDESGVSDDIKTKELELGREKALQEGKPENIVDKIAQGTLNKWMKENTLLDQAFVKDPKKSVKQVLKDVSADITIKEFKRVALG